MLADVVVLGGGPAALVIAADLSSEGLRVTLLSSSSLEAPWPNTFGIWAGEVDDLGLAHLLGHRWSNCVSYFGTAGTTAALRHNFDYGLFDKVKLQRHLLDRCRRHGVTVQRGRATAVVHDSEGSTLSVEPVGTESLLPRPGNGGAAAVGSEARGTVRSRLVVDASGHAPCLLQRDKEAGAVAGQAAYGIVGRFSANPVEAGQFVLMDYRSDHLSAEERAREAPTFLYAMDWGNGVFFVEETSLAMAPPVPYDMLKNRLQRRLAHRGIGVTEVQHEEFCLFPMNHPLPRRDQRLLGFGGAASMVHPASGYMVGALLRRGPGFAAAIAAGLRQPQRSLDEVAAAAWQVLWSGELVRRHGIYRFGLEKLMRFSEATLHAHFDTFFNLPLAIWTGFLTNTLPLVQLVKAMALLLWRAPWPVKWGLIIPRGRELALLWRGIRG
ncbi:MAG: lycopene cyclase family protein [Aphanocapsa feldmannii 277cV]|uniref:Lycopene cyclase family protein n=3 Tax=Aphanocapsa feldmannii TaxID=192050 RepID=A0A524RR62_9CHRO|nr:MAG: lycopene cyclase family protein [Aphanocapsa feldmannii 277cV]